MVAGHLQEKKGYYYIVLSYKDDKGKRKTKWLPTKLTVKGNKKRAERMLQEARRDFVPEGVVDSENILFADFMVEWLRIIKPNVAATTYASYFNSVNKVIVPYFRKTNIQLKKLKPSDIQKFYAEQLSRVNGNTVIHYHANIHKALKYAVKSERIDSNPADKVERPKKPRYTGSFYSSKEVEKLFEAAKGTYLEIPIFLGAFYGLRRSEVVGLKWSAINFDKDTITINHTVTTCHIDGLNVQTARDSTKNKSSMRTLPLVPAFKTRLLALKAQQEHYQRICGRSYDRRYLDYVCVNEMGTLISPNYISGTFPKLLEKNGLRKIRFHDLRHSCASLLLANNVPMKQIQEWLGHSDFSTTANIYAHLDYNSKIASADAMLTGLKGALNVWA